MRRAAAAVVVVLLSAALPLPAAGAAEAATVRRIGVVNLSRVFDGYRRTQAQEEKLKELAEDAQAERESRVREIRNMRDELLLLNDESRVEQKARIEDKMKGLAEFDRSFQTRLQTEKAESLRSILEEIKAVVSEYARERGYDLILTDQTVLFGAEGADVTADIVELLNRRYTAKR